MSPTLKVVLLILAAVAHRVAVKPPQPPATKEDRINKGTLFERAPRVLGAGLQIVTIGWLMTECAMLLALSSQNSQASGILSSICANSSPSLHKLSTFSPSFLLGIGMMYISGVIRLWCYKTLGTLFTYEITIRRDHKLITSGPYAFVRHPGYTASTLMMIGTAVTVLSSGSLIDECRIMSTPARWIVLPYVAFLGWVIVALLGRGKVEDAGLKKEFGEIWERYSHSVPCRFVPGLV